MLLSVKVKNFFPRSTKASSRKAQKVFYLEAQVRHLKKLESSLPRSSIYIFRQAQKLLPEKFKSCFPRISKVPSREAQKLLTEETSHE